MLVAGLVALLAVALGAALASFGAERQLGPVRSFALSASLATIVVHLLPESVAVLGLGAAPLFGLGLLLPLLAERGVARWPSQGGAPGRSGHLRLEASYVGLLLHSLGDGLALGAFSSGGRHGHSHWDVLIAVSAHTVPVVAVLVIAFGARYGRRVALVRAAGLLGVTWLGIGAAELVPPALTEAVTAWVGAVVGGTLLHVVFHGLRELPPRSAGARSADLAAAVAGVVVALLGNAEHRGGPGDVETAPDVLGQLAASLLRLALGAAPALLAALLLTLALSGLVLRAAPGRLHSLLPALRLDTLLLGGALLGAPAALAVWLSGALPALLLGASDARPSPSPAAGLGGRLGSLLHRGAPPLVLGLLGAAFMDSVLTAEATLTATLPERAGLLLLLAAAAGASTPAALPLGAVLTSKGLEPSALLVALLAGPSLRLVIQRKPAHPRPAAPRRRRLAAAALVGGAGLLALGVRALGWSLDPSAPGLLGPVASHLALTLLGLGTLLDIWHSGLRGWLATLVAASAEAPAGEPPAPCHTEGT